MPLLWVSILLSIGIAALFAFADGRNHPINPCPGVGEVGFEVGKLLPNACPAGTALVSNVPPLAFLKVTVAKPEGGAANVRTVSGALCAETPLTFLALTVKV